MPWIDPDDYIHPLPMSSVGYIVNTDWARQNSDTAKKLFVALARAGRDYCQAYHHGPNRAEIIDIFLKNRIGTDRDLLDRMAWQSRTPNGEFNVASILDMQAFFQREGTIDKGLASGEAGRPELRHRRGQGTRPVRTHQQDEHAQGLPLARRKCRNPSAVS